MRSAWLDRMAATAPMLAAASLLWVCPAAKAQSIAAPGEAAHQAKFSASRSPGDLPPLGAAELQLAISLVRSAQSMAFIKVWKVCSALRLEASCARLA